MLTHNNKVVASEFVHQAHYTLTFAPTSMNNRHVWTYKEGTEGVPGLTGLNWYEIPAKPD